jgi:hypothetical protein
LTPAPELRPDDPEPEQEIDWSSEVRTEEKRRISEMEVKTVFVKVMLSKKLLIEQEQHLCQLIFSFENFSKKASGKSKIIVQYMYP